MPAKQQPVSQSGLDMGQLMLMRMLMGQQKPNTFKIDPVQDVGQGISVAGNNILQAITQRRAQADEQAMMQNMMAQAQASQQADAQQAQQSLQGREGVFQSLTHSSPEVAHNAALQPDAVYNNLLDAAVKSGQYEQGVQNLVTQGVPDGIARSVMSSPEALATYAKGFATPLAVNNQNTMTGPIDTSNPAGYNLFHQLNNFNPQTPAEALTQSNTANSGALDYAIKRQQAPALMAQPGLQNQSTATGIQGQQLSNIHQNLVNGATPGLLTNELNQGTIGNNQAQFNLGQHQTALHLLTNGVATGDLFDPAKSLNLQALIQGNGGPDLGSTVGQIGAMYGGPKDHNLTLKRMQQYQHLLPPPEYAPLLTVPYQGR